MARSPSTRTPPAAAGKPASKTKPGTAVATRTKGTEVADWEKQLEADAEKLAEQEKGGGFGKSFSFKGGVLSFDGAPIKGNQIPVVIVGSMIEKALYEGRYDPNNPDPPVCFALDTDTDNLAPIPEDVADLKNDQCADCPFNQWGSADTGRGKACKDVRRLAMIPAGVIEKNGDVTLIDDPKAVDKAEFGFAKLPPTSLNSWAGFVRTLASTMKRPPHGVFAMLRVEPDEVNQFKVIFEPLDLIDKKLMPSVYTRHLAAMEELKRPYTYPTEEQRAQRQAQNRGGGRGGRGNAAGGARGAARGGGAAKAGSARGRKY